MNNKVYMVFREIIIVCMVPFAVIFLTDLLVQITSKRNWFIFFPNYINCSPTELKGRILEVEKSWRALYKEKERQRKRRSQSSLELYYTDCFPAHSLYRFDDNLIHIQSKPTKGRSNELTTIVCKKTARADDLYNKYLQEIEDIIAESTRVDLENQPVLSF